MNSFFSPLALTVLVAAIVCGLTVSLWLLPIGLIAYTALVLIGARMPQTAPAPRVARPRLTNPGFRSQINQIERTEDAIQRSIGQAQGALSRLLTPIGNQTRELVAEAYMLAEKGQIIEDYLSRLNPQDLQSRIAAAAQQLQQTSDPYTRQQLEETRNALIEKQQNARDLTTYIGRIQAQLQNIAASLDNVLAETVRLRTADMVSANSLTNQVAQRLNDLKSDMDTFQRVLDTALAGTGP